MNKLDAALQSACPCVMVPRYEPLECLDTDGHRFLMGGNALYMEIRRPWIHAIFKVVDVPIALPYGRPPELFSIPLYLRDIADGLSRFIQRAREASPLEHAAWLTFQASQNRTDYVEPEIISQSAGHIQYRRPDTTADCLPFLDCHSHGQAPAFFSSVDDRDDLNDDAKLAFVAGCLDQREPSVAMRFVGLGLSLDLTQWACRVLASASDAPTLPSQIFQNQPGRTGTMPYVI